MMSDSTNPTEPTEIPEFLDDVEDAAPAGTAPPKTGPLRFARMTGSSIAARDAAPWVTDFLNASYYRRGGDRDVDDLRLAFCILTTFWYRRGGGRRRLRIADVVPFHRTFGADRFSTDGSGRGTLSRGQLFDGA